nr:acetyl-coenzyme a carboxyl transferase alpha/beta chain [Amycolatopsis sp.]
MTRTATTTSTPEWLRCPGCRGLIYGKRLHRNLGVCPDCDRHLPVTADDRLDQLLDPGSLTPLDFPVETSDPLRFTDTEPYPDRVRSARERTGLAEAVRCATGTIGGCPVVVCAMDFRFLGGSLGSAVGELITLAAETALYERSPLLLVTASGGARMQEGVLSLMQMAKTAQALGQLDQAGILTITLVTDPTFGGVAASFATLSDLIIAEPGARMGFAGPRVIAQTIRAALPAGFQTAEYLLEHGMIDLIRPRAELRGTLATILSIGSRRPQQASRRPAAAEPVVHTDPGALPEQDAWDVVRRARRLDRPATRDYLELVFDEFLEFHGDRVSGDCRAIVGGFARLADIPVLVLGHQKGHTPAELAENNYGMPTPDGYRKAARLLRCAAKLGLPVVTFVDTPGAYPGVEAEERGQSVVIAELIRQLAALPVPVVTVVIGEGGSGGALALAVANRVLICANAYYSVISPEGCAAILWDDPAAAPVAAAALRLDARQLLELGIVDGVIAEPPGGSEQDRVAAADRVRAALLAELGGLLAFNPPQLIVKRHKKFRAFGAGLTATGHRPETTGSVGESGHVR